MVAKIKVNPPTHAKKHQANQDYMGNKPRSGVIPSDNPTVPIADAVSNKAVISGISSVLLITIPPQEIKRYTSKKL